MQHTHVSGWYHCKDRTDRRGEGGWVPATDRPSSIINTDRYAAGRFLNALVEMFVGMVLLPVRDMTAGGAVTIAIVHLSYRAAISAEDVRNSNKGSFTCSKLTNKYCRKSCSARARHNFHGWISLGGRNSANQFHGYRRL